MMHPWEPLYDITLPPGSRLQTVPHPFQPDRECGVGIVDAHRFAFYFWNRWRTNDLPPDLVSIDWHKDLAPPSESERNDLDMLNLTDPKEVALFCWARMNPYNDGHVLSAAWLDLIGDIYVLCKQKFTTPDQFESRDGKIHRIQTFDRPEELGKILDERFKTNDPQRTTKPQTILDIDLDYFTESEEFRGAGAGVVLNSREEIAALLEPSAPWMRIILDNIAGMTIAVEPGFCGGYPNALQLLKSVSVTLFDPPLMHEGCRWRETMIS